MNPPDTPPPPISPEFERFHRHVLENPDLLDRIREIQNPQRLERAAVELGRVHGFHFTVADVSAALLATRQSWFERHVR